MAPLVHPLSSSGCRFSPARLGSLWSSSSRRWPRANEERVYADRRRKERSLAGTRRNLHGTLVRAYRCRRSDAVDGSPDRSRNRRLTHFPPACIASIKRNGAEFRLEEACLS